jgi:hypothetical protein
MYKRILGIAMLVVLPALSSLCEADEDIGRLALEAADSRYEEPGYMKETGNFYGLSWEWMNAMDRFGTVGFRGELRGGKPDYDGATQSGVPVKSKGEDYVGSMEASYGWTFRPGGMWLTPYIGLGYRDWRDRIEDSTAQDGTPVSGYRRQIEYYYAPVGVHLSGTAGSSWGWTARAQGNYLIRGKVASHLEDVDQGYDTIKNTQKHGWGYEVAIAWSHVSENRWAAFFIEPYYAYWKVKDSDMVDVYYYGTLIGYALEPKNNTKIAGIRIGWEYR